MASKGVNKVILIGNLGKDPEIRYLPNGGAIASLTLATSESWKDKQTGEPKEKTEWHRVVVFGKLAEIAGEYLKKGSQVYFEGKLQTRKWQDQAGQERYTTEVVIDQNGGVMQMLGGRAQSEQPQQGGWNNQAPQQHAPAQQGFAPQKAPQPQAYAQPQHAPQQAPMQPRQGFAQQPPMQQAPKPTYSEPPMDFDDDIPF